MASDETKVASNPVKRGAYAVKRTAKKITRKVKKDNENGARKDLLEQLFYDFNTSKAEIYWANFFRGIFFGVGSLLGGTLVVALILSLLSFLTDVPGAFGDFIQYIVDVVKSPR